MATSEVPVRNPERSHQQIQRQTQAEALRDQSYRTPWANSDDSNVADDDNDDGDVGDGDYNGNDSERRDIVPTQFVNKVQHSPVVMFSVRNGPNARDGMDITENIKRDQKTRKNPSEVH